MAYPSPNTGNFAPNSVINGGLTGAQSLANNSISSGSALGGAVTWTLPAVASGGIVTIVNLDTTAGHTITVKSAEGAAASVAGVAGNTGVVVPVAAAAGFGSILRLVSDGTNWQAC